MEHSSKDLLGMMKPVSSIHHTSQSADSSYNITLQGINGSMYFSAAFISALNIISGSDRIGLYYHPEIPTLVMMYVTTNHIGTQPIKKSKGNPYKIYTSEWCNLLKKRFRIGIKSTFKLYIHPDLTYTTVINGMKEKCYLIYDKTSERTDIDEFVKAEIIAETKATMKLIEDASKNN